MNPNFTRADSGNLPKVNGLMVGLFFANNPDFFGTELKNIKTSISARESYGDDAIGYVQVFRETDFCTLKCQVCPEHRIRKKPYNVTMVINEKEGEILSCQCHDCAASAGGCKHAVAVVTWVHRRTEDPACTSVECYWKKPRLSAVGTSLKFIKVKELNKSKVDTVNSNDGVLVDFICEAKKRKISDCELLKYESDFKHSDLKQFSLHNILIDLNSNKRSSVDSVVEALKNVITKNSISAIEKGTRKQYKNSLWYELRYGRITASKAYEASRCKTADGTLVAAIMGAKPFDTAAMKRGRNLEDNVRKELEKKLKLPIKPAGLFISQHYPMVAASPDGIVYKDGAQNATVEIKCPTTNKTMANYIKLGKITKKFLSQVQLQMYTTNCQKCYFCVADADFENNKTVEIMEIEYNHEYVIDLLENITLFWKTHIYPILCESTICE